MPDIVTNTPRPLTPDSQVGGDRVAIDDPTLRLLADRIAGTLQMAAARALAHEAEPQQHPLPAGADSVEQIVVRYAASRPPAARREAAARAAQTLTALTAEFRGDLDRVNLRSAEPVAEQVARLEPPDALKLGAARLTSARLVKNRIVADLAPAELFALRDGRVHRLAAPVTAPVVTPVITPVPPPTGVVVQKPGASAIDEKYAALGGPAGFLGKATSPVTRTPNGKGSFRHFAGGSIYWTAAAGAHEVHGAIRDKWASLGWETGYLGFPTTDETPTPDTVGRFSHFTGGSVYWTPTTGARAVHAKVRDAWQAQGWELGPLGYPVGDTSGVGGAAMSNLFQGGRVDWTASGGAKAVHPVTKLAFRLRSVRCVEESNEIGSDELDFGGAATDAALKSAIMSRFRISDDFDSGEVVNYAPPRVAHTFDLLSPAWWPKSYLVMMMLSEIDSGGFNDTLVQLLNQVRGIVEKELVKLGAAAVGSWVGGAIGTAFPGVGTVVGAVVGAVIGYAVGKVFDWLASVFNDDNFLPLALSVDVPTVHGPWGGASVTPEWFYWVKGHGAHYEIRGDWALLP